MQSISSDDLLAHAKWVKDLSRVLVFDPERADDLEQEAWLAAIEKPPKDTSNLRSWLGRVVLNTARQIGRADARRTRREKVLPAIQSPPSPDELVEQAEMHRIVVSAILDLEEPYRTTILLRFFRGYSSREIADFQQVPQGTVRSRLKRGLHHLRAQLDKRVSGGRQAWVGGLMPLAFSANTAQASAISTSTISLLLGAVVMGIKTKLGITASCLAIAGSLAALWAVSDTPPVIASRAASDVHVPEPNLPPIDENPAHDAPAVSEERELVAEPDVPPVPSSSETPIVFAGVVRDQDGSPIEAASLEVIQVVADWTTAYPSIRESPPLATASTNAAGRFRLEAIPEIPDAPFEITDPLLSLRVSAETYRTAGSGPPSAPGEELQITLEPDAILRGRVLDSETGQPIASALITDSHGDETTSAPDGSYCLKNNTPGKTFEIRASADQYAEYRERITLNTPGIHEFDITLRAGTRLQILVVDRETRAPISGVEIRGSSVSEDPIARTDLSGNTLLRIHDGSRVSLEFSADGYGTTSWTWHVVDSTALTSPTVPLVACAWIEGTISDEDGNLVEGATIYAKNSDQPFNRLTLTPEEQRLNILPGHTSIEAAIGSARSDERGQFRLPVIPSDSPYHLRVKHRNFAPTEAGPIVLASSGSRTDVAVQVQRGATIHGQVQLNGQPLTRISLRWAEATGSGTGLAMTNTKGEYTFENVSLGSVRLSLSHTRSRLQDQIVVIDVEDAGTYRHDFLIDQPLAAISGRVFGSSGEPLPNALVAAGHRTDDGRYLHFSARTSPDGAYSIEVVPPFEYEVTARLDTAAETESSVAAGATNIDFLFSPIGVLRMLFVDSATRLPIKAVTSRHFDALSWRPADTEVFRNLGTPVGIDGRVELRLPVGEVDISVFLTDSGYALKTVTGIQVPSEATSEPVEIPLVRGAEARLRFQGATTFDRNQWSGHLIFALEDSQLPSVRGPFENQGGQSNWRINGVNMWFGEPGLANQMLKFDDLGNASCQGLAPGRYHIRCYPDDYIFEPDSFSVPVGRDAAVQIRWSYK